MNIYAEKCWAGNSSYYFRLTSSTQNLRIQVRAPNGEWTREVAKRALDYLENNVAIPRRKVRFIHK